MNRILCFLMLFCVLFLGFSQYYQIINLEVVSIGFDHKVNLALLAIMAFFCSYHLVKIILKRNLVKNKKTILFFSLFLIGIAAWRVSPFILGEPQDDIHWILHSETTLILYVIAFMLTPVVLLARTLEST